MSSSRYDTLADWLSAEDEETEEIPRVPPMPRLTVDEGGDLVLGDLLGEGGMAIVLRAEQRVLGREVAVKRAKRPGDPSTVRAILQEAHIAAQLDHPHIVPIHLLGQTPEGDPLVVMRAVEGVSWESELVQDRGPEPERLARHLRVFAAVCDVVDMAHERGFVHRDIKPGNVQLGRHGEVYLLDWGLAASLDVGEIRPGGTPAYMAPEMTQPGPPDRRSDVFLLGATLHEVVTGEPVRTQAQVDRLTSGLGSEFGLRELPPGLDAVVSRACAPTPEARFATAAELRDAVLSWQVHRAEETLLAAVRERARAFEAAADAALSDPEQADAAMRARERFAEARFGFQHILAEHPDVADARLGLGLAIERMARVELSQAQPAAARALLASHPDAPPAFVTDVEAAAGRLEAEAREQARLAGLARAFNAEEVAQDWLILVVALSVSLLVGVVGSNLVFGNGMTAARAVAVLSPIVVGVGGTLYWRRGLLAHPLGRRLFLGFVGAFSCVAVNRAVAIVAGEDLVSVLAVDSVIIASWLFGVSVYHRNHLPVGVVTLLVGGGLRFLPPSELRVVLFNSLHLGIFAWVAVLWWRELKRAETPR